VAAKERKNEFPNRTSNNINDANIRMMWAMTEIERLPLIISKRENPEEQIVMIRMTWLQHACDVTNLARYSLIEVTECQVEANEFTLRLLGFKRRQFLQMSNQHTPKPLQVWLNTHSDRRTSLDSRLWQNFTYSRRSWRRQHACWRVTVFMPDASYNVKITNEVGEQ